MKRKHVMQFGDGGADWCIHCGTLDIYCRPGDECEAEQIARFDIVNKPENLLRLYCDLFGDQDLTDAGRAVLAEQRKAA